MESKLNSNAFDWSNCEELESTAVKKMLALADSLDGWKSAGEKEKVHIYTKYTDGT